MLASDAVVLRTFTFGETSKVVVLLTRERGKLRAVAKGARGPRSRYGASLESMSEVRVGLYGRQDAELYRLGPCELLRSPFAAASASLEGGLVLTYLAELLDVFSPEGQADERAYRLARAVVEALGRGVGPLLLARYAEAWVLKLHGIYPQLDRCAACAGVLPVSPRRYQSRAHGFVCDGCHRSSEHELPPDCVAFLHDCFRNPPWDLGAAPVRSGVLEAFHLDLIEAHLERPLRSRRVLADLARADGTSRPGGAVR